MTSSIQPHVGGGRVRTGCVTCKARRVKCDERKPKCLRCERAGKLCEGYRLPNPRNHRGTLTIVAYVPTPHGRLSAQPGTTIEEQRALSYFQHKTAHEIAGCFSAELWSRFMLLVAQHQSSIKHALIALGAVHEAFVLADDASQQSTPEYALQHYCLAIREVLNRKEAKQEIATEIVLMSCLVFACLESLRGHHQSAISHLVSGMKVLAEEQTERPDSGHAYVPHSLLRATFVRLDSQLMHISSHLQSAPHSLTSSIEISVPKCYTSIEAAMEAMDVLFNQIAHLFSEIDNAIGPGLASAKVVEAQLQLVKFSALRSQWLAAFEAFLESGTSSYHPRDAPCLILRIYNHVLFILLGIDFINAENEYDKYVDSFRNIVDDAEEYICKTSTIVPSPNHPQYAFPHQEATASSKSQCTFPSFSHNSIPTLSPTDAIHSTSASPFLAPRPPPRFCPNFSVTLGPVAALYFASARCRSTPIRHKALYLLKTCNRREGLWDSRLAAIVAERIITIEETHLRPYASKPKGYQMGDTDISAGNIPEHYRVKTVEVHFGPENAGMAAYTLTPVTGLHAIRQEGAAVAFKELVRW